MKKEQRAMHLVAIEEKVVFYLLTYGFNIKRKNIKEKKEVLQVLIHLKCGGEGTVKTSFLLFDSV